MPFTKEEIDIFNKMFYIQTEYTGYKSNKLTSKGLLEEAIFFNEDLNSEEAIITLANGEVYEIPFGTSDDASGFAMDAFTTLLNFNLDEEKFEKYLNNESAFQRS